MIDGTVGYSGDKDSKNDKSIHAKISKKADNEKYDLRHIDCNLIGRVLKLLKPNKRDSLLMQGLTYTSMDLWS